jgi:O-antigen/teichoic acid export membrane protein
MTLKDRLIAFLRYTERYTKTDMIYVFQTGFWSNIATISVTAGSFLLYIVFGHFVPKEVYGTYQYLLSVGAIVGAFTLTGMNSAVTRAVALGYEGSLIRSVWIQLKWNVLPTIGAWIIGGYYIFMHNPTLGWGLVLIGIFVPFNNALNTYGAYLGGKKDFKRGFLYGLWWNIPYYIAVAIVAFYFKSAIILLAANLIAQALGLCIAYWQTIHTFKPNKEVGEETVRYGGHLSVMGMFINVVSRFDDILAFHFLGPISLATYSFATAAPDRITTLFKFLPAAAFPKFATKSPEEIRKTLGTRIWIGTGIIAVVAFLYILIARPFFELFFPAYVAAVPYSQAYALIIITSVSVNIISTALTTAKNIRTLYIYNVSTPIVQLALQVVGILMYGLWGLIIGKVLAYVFMALFGLFLYWRIDSNQSVLTS